MGSQLAEVRVARAVGMARREGIIELVMYAILYELPEVTRAIAVLH
jgi:hypothetical protein